MSTLNVHRDETLVGYLSQERRRDMTFRYAASYLENTAARPISVSLPLQEDAFDAERSHAWFSNLLPEGEVRGHVARRLGVSERNDFALLEAIGGDCAGALRVVPASVAGSAEDRLVPLPWEELERKIAATPRPSLLALILGDGELRLSLAGAQDKLPVHFDGERLALPNGAYASTHLLKLPSGTFPNLVANELFCLTLARRVGLAVPPAKLAPTKTPILLVERYDRRTDADGRTRRLHQEDFCQALSIPPESKYENEGGPSLRAIFEVLGRASRAPMPDKRELLRWVLFNYLIGNADGHAKNVSLLHDMPDGSAGPCLAPFYDLVCTEAYGELSRKLAQRIGGEYRVRYLRRRHWERFAESIEVKFGYLRSVAGELCGQVDGAVGAVERETGELCPGVTTLGRVVEVIRGRVSGLRREFDAPS